MTALLLSLLVLWIMGFGMSMMFQRHGQYVNWTGRIFRQSVRAVVRYLTRFVRWAWRHYWRQIVSFAAGVLVTLYFTCYLH